MDETPHAAGVPATPPAPEPAPSTAPPAPPPEPGATGAKECILCGEMIPAFADRCSHCGGFLPIVEGRAFGQHFFFLVVSLAIFIGTCLPWEGQWWDSNGYRSIHGGFLLVLSAYGIIAFFFNVFHRRMIVWPLVLAALDASYVGWRRVAQLAASETARTISFDGDLGAKKAALIRYCQLFGPGLWLVVVFSTLFWLVFVWSVIQGGRAAGARKEAEKAARAAKKR